MGLENKVGTSLQRTAKLLLMLEFAILCIHWLQKKFKKLTQNLTLVAFLVHWDLGEKPISIDFSDIPTEHSCSNFEWIRGINYRHFDERPHLEGIANILYIQTFIHSIAFWAGLATDINRSNFHAKLSDE